MVRHQPLQYYEPQLCLSCLTGIYGCRWKRYQRSHDDTTPWERLWFLLLTFTFGLTLTWLYFWWEVHNDYDEFNWYLYNRMGYWSDWSVPILITTAAAFTYVAGLLVLALCHIAVGQQMNLHWLHKVISLFKINPKHSFEVLPFVPNYNRVVMEQIHVLGTAIAFLFV